MLSKEWVKDAAERTVMTFITTLAVGWLAAPSLDLEANQALLVAAATAAATTFKTFVAGLFTGGGSAVPATSTAATKTTG